jgi:transposase
MKVLKYFKMKRMPQEATLFLKSEISNWHASVTPLPLPENVELRSITMSQMEKFKPLRESVKPMIALSIESRLAEIEQRIPENHLCRMVKEVVHTLDTSQIESVYSFEGQRSYHPRLMLSILFFGYATGIRSSRKLEDKCISDDYYKFLMQYYTPDYRTISDFRKDNVDEINSYFVSILRIFEKLGYTKVGKIYIDGTKIKANASKKRTRTVKGFEKWLSLLEEEIASILKEAAAIDKEEDEKFKVCEEEKELLKKLSNRKYLKRKIEEALNQMSKEDKQKLNLTDNTAHDMKTGGSKDIGPKYNCQAAATVDGVITVAEAVEECNDRHQLEPVVEKSESNTGQKVDEAVADSGYASYDNYEYLDNKKLNGYVPDQYFRQYKSGEYQKEKNRYHFTNFRYDKNTDRYICPDGGALVYWKTRKNKTKARDWNHKVYIGRDCKKCNNRALCTKSKRRELLVDLREPLLVAMREKLMSDEGALKYFMRQYIIEPIFGHLKYNLGYKAFLLRGLDKVNAEFKLMCIGWNIKKLLKLGFTPEMVKNL